MSRKHKIKKKKKISKQIKRNQKEGRKRKRKEERTIWEKMQIENEKYWQHYWLICLEASIFPSYPASFKLIFRILHFPAASQPSFTTIYSPRTNISKDFRVFFTFRLFKQPTFFPLSVFHLKKKKKKGKANLQFCPWRSFCENILFFSSFNSKPLTPF